MTEIVQLVDGQPVTTTVAIAGGTATQHKNVIALVRTYQSDLEEFGKVAFETRPKPAGQIGGGATTMAILNEDQAMLLLTYMSNTPIVRGFKKALVHAFRELINQLKVVKAPDRETVIALGFAAAQEALGEVSAALEASRNYARELEPVARSFVVLAEGNGSMDVRAAATTLSNDHGIIIGEKRLFEFLETVGWTYRSNSDGSWRPYQVQVDLGRMTTVRGKEFFHEGFQEMRQGTPKLRITDKGLHELRVLLTAAAVS